jgi:hypothetical protein
MKTDNYACITSLCPAWLLQTFYPQYDYRFIIRPAYESFTGILALLRGQTLDNFHFKYKTAF